jgi:hypothetical protein
MILAEVLVTVTAEDDGLFVDPIRGLSPNLAPPKHRNRCHLCSTEAPT